jgi:hypothetical protein
MPNQMSLRKHRKSGTSSRPRRDKMLEARDRNRDDAKRKRAKRRRTTWYDTLQEAMRWTRST